MKFVLALTALVAIGMCATVTAQSERDATIARYDSDNIGVEGYNYDYQTSNGIAASEQGTVVNAGTENEAIAARGQFNYQGPDGITYSVTYIADENGFQPQGDHLPTPPPAPGS